MKQSKRTNGPMATPLKVFLSEEEKARYEAFLEKFGGKQGPFARQLILREMERAQTHGDGSHESRELAARLATAEAARSTGGQA